MSALVAVDVMPVGHHRDEPDRRPFFREKEVDRFVCILKRLETCRFCK